MESSVHAGTKSTSYSRRDTEEESAEQKAHRVRLTGYSGVEEPSFFAADVFAVRACLSSIHGGLVSSSGKGLDVEN